MSIHICAILSSVAGSWRPRAIAPQFNDTGQNPANSPLIITNRDKSPFLIVTIRVIYDETSGDRWQGRTTMRPDRFNGDHGTGAHMTDKTSGVLTRRSLLGAFAATAVAAAPTFSNAAGLLRGAGDVRRLRMHSPRTGERVDMIYWIEGDYLADAVKEINYFMRDWRNNQVRSIDTRTIDIMAAAHNLLDVSEPYMLISGYRSPSTNAMLRSRSSGVAKNSRHIQGEAADLRLSSRSVSQMFRAAKACGGGGVGRYSRSNFIHVDCGPVRSWGS